MTRYIKTLKITHFADINSNVSFVFLIPTEGFMIEKTTGIIRNKDSMQAYKTHICYVYARDWGSPEFYSEYVLLVYALRPLLMNSINGLLVMVNKCSKFSFMLRLHEVFFSIFSYKIYIKSQIKFNTYSQ